MASVTRRIEVCDVCRSIEKPIFKRVRIAPDGERLRTVAFCQEDFAPMAEILRSMSESWPSADGRRQNRKVTMDQIEVIKASGPRKRAAKATAPARRGKKAVSSPSEA